MSSLLDYLSELSGTCQGGGEVESLGEQQLTLCLLQTLYLVLGIHIFTLAPRPHLPPAAP